MSNPIDISEVPSIDSPPAVISSGTAAARPAPQIAGELYYHTDGEVIDIAVDDSGLAWQQLIDLNAAPGSLPPTSIAHITADVAIASSANPADRIFKPDVLVTNTLNALELQGGGDYKIKLPADGTYRIRAKLYVSIDSADVTQAIKVDLELETAAQVRSFWQDHEVEFTFAPYRAPIEIETFVTGSTDDYLSFRISVLRGGTSGEAHQHLAYSFIEVSGV
ncbi:MAG: hypothetical protein ACPG7F_00335 [Aggregatilineales bacterium]